MKKIEVFILSTIICLMMSCVPTAPARKISSNAELPVRGDTESLVSGNTEFALDLYSKLKQENGNIFFSPYSISAAMGMVYAGARGETEKQMAKTLKFSSDQQHLHPAFTELDIELSKLQDNNVRLSVANSLWPQKKFKFSDDYLTLTERYYGVSITPLDYKSSAEIARTQINKWVSDKTENKINDILQPGILNSYTRLVLINAIYFNGKWANPFKNWGTKDTPFHLSASNSVNVPMMNQTSYFRYAETDDLQILEASYIGNNLSMLILLPKKIDGLEQFESRLSLENLRNWRKSLKEKEVIVYLPKFRMTSQFELKKVLQQMGMTDAFSDGNADFSGMAGKSCKNCKDNEPECCLYFSAAIHKAYIDVDEKGTEAAATAVIGMAATCAGCRPQSPPVFRADHPFLFLIQERQNGSILFMGRVTDPSKSGE